MDVMKQPLDPVAVTEFINRDWSSLLEDWSQDIKIYILKQSINSKDIYQPQR